MITYIILTTVILIISYLSYLTSTLYGFRTSGIDRLPPHFTHLRKRLKAETKAKSGHRLEDIPETHLY
jgi:hypothetical protein